MVVANTAAGLSSTHDLTQPVSLAALRDLLDAGQVTALSILRNGTQHALPAPRGARNHVFGAEPLFSADGAIAGERIFVQAGDVRVIVSAVFASPVVRTDLVRTGAMRYYPRGGRHRG